MVNVLYDCLEAVKAGVEIHRMCLDLESAARTVRCILDRLYRQRDDRVTSLPSCGVISRLLLNNRL